MPLNATGLLEHPFRFEARSLRPARNCRRLPKPGQPCDDRPARKAATLSPSSAAA